MFSECRKCYFRDPHFKNFLGGHAARPPQLNFACGTRLTPSAIAYYPGGRARKMGRLAVLPHHWRILKNALMCCKIPREIKLVERVSLRDSLHNPILRATPNH
jgi:hypothetical protein